MMDSERLQRVAIGAIAVVWLGAWFALSFWGWRAQQDAPRSVARKGKRKLPGYLILKLSPAHARVSVDGEWVRKKGASRGLSLRVGAHRLRVVAKGFVPKTKDIQVFEEDASLLRISLRPLPVWLEVTSVPAGAKVTLNRRPVGRTPLRIEVVPRWYHARGSKAGFVTGKRDIHVLPNRKGQRFHLRLGGALRISRGHHMRWVPGRYFGRGLSLKGMAEARTLCQLLRKRACPSTWFSAEQPQRLTWVDGFWIDQWEVTRGQYRKCVEAGVCVSNALKRIDKKPMTSVTWGEARKFCRWRGARLPREVEWELAAKGPKGLSFPWGKKWDGRQTNHGTFDVARGSSAPDPGDGHRFAAPVGAFPTGRSPYRVEDMAGNVAEWVADCYFTSFYRRAPERNPFHNPEDCESRSVRGGSWIQPAWELRTTARQPLPPTTRSLAVGFRCAQTARTKPKAKKE